MTKYSSNGTALQVDIGGVWTTIGGVRSIDFPSGDVQFYDGTDLASGVSIEDGELTNQSTPPEWPVELFYDPADTTHNLLARDPQQGGVHRDFKVVLPDAGSNEVTCTGAIRQFKPSAKAKEPLVAEMPIKLRYVASFPAAA